MRRAKVSNELKMFSGVLVFNLVVVAIVLELIFRSAYFSNLKDGLELNGFNYTSPFAMQSKSWYHFIPQQVSRIGTQKTTEFTYTFNYNSEGFRDAEWLTTKNSGVKRVLALGDSFTEGYGTSGDSTWVKLLEDCFKSSAVNPEKYELMNGGVRGCDPFFSYVLLRDKLAKYQPDHVILAINQSDLMEIALRGGFERFQSDTTIKFRKKAPWWETLFQHCFIVRAAVRYLITADGYFRSEEEVRQDDIFGTRQLCKAIVSFNQFCVQRNTRFTVIFHPFEFECQPDSKTDNFDGVKVFCNGKGIECIDLYSSFQERYKRNPNLFWPIDHHYNSQGNYFMATEIYKAITNN